ncbi:FG-GAP-like repeat-containing protein [Streptomyces sp. NBC_01218]|uniref:FG-GAP repeat domain-containing protein n=1 Tax=unclassified Streptomyces TaxID=2593676 RepID=UPI002E16190B|nr:FG-GAP-like repeat-containing protein [Streptomyces sp. NBC_01218]
MFTRLKRFPRRMTVGAAVAAVAALGVGTATALPALPWSAASAAADAGQAPAAAAVTTGAPMLPLFARKSTGHLYDYEPSGSGGWKAAVDMGGGFSAANAFAQVRTSEGGTATDLYFRIGNVLYYTAERGNDTKIIGSGWSQYNLLMSPGNMLGTSQDELVARDAAGALWLYQGKADGTLAARVRIGTSGWNGMNAIVGRGDYTGDGKGDLLARSTTGTLYIYPGTGNAAADAGLGTRITVGTGWEAYKTLVSTGDCNGDGRADLIGIDTAGASWLFKGTGKSATPFEARVQNGTSGWASFDAYF